MSGVLESLPAIGSFCCRVDLALISDESLAAFLEDRLLDCFGLSDFSLLGDSTDDRRLDDLGNSGKS